MRDAFADANCCICHHVVMVLSESHEVDKIEIVDIGMSACCNFVE